MKSIIRNFFVRMLCFIIQVFNVKGEFGDINGELGDPVTIPFGDLVDYVNDAFGDVSTLSASFGDMTNNQMSYVPYGDSKQKIAAVPTNKVVKAIENKAPAVGRQVIQQAPVTVKLSKIFILDGNNYAFLSGPHASNETSFDMVQNAIKTANAKTSSNPLSSVVTASGGSATVTLAHSLLGTGTSALFPVLIITVSSTMLGGKAGCPATMNITAKNEAGEAIASGPYTFKYLQSGVHSELVFVPGVANKGIYTPTPIKLIQGDATTNIVVAVTGLGDNDSLSVCAPNTSYGPYSKWLIRNKFVA